MKQIAATSNQIQVTAIPYAVWIKAWERVARQRSQPREQQKCADNALGVLTQMKQDGVTPTAPTYNALIMALLATSPANAIFYFLELEESYRQKTISLDTRTFNCALNAIATGSKPDFAEKAMNLLQRMLGYARDDSSVHPDGTTFNIILKILSKSQSPDAAHKAQTMLVEMENMSTVKPSFISYLTCIIAWGRSKDESKFDDVRGLLVRCQESHRTGKLLDNRLAISVYNGVLLVCYHNFESFPSEALETAQFCMEQLRQRKKAVHPDTTTYLSFFQVLAKLSDETVRENLLKDELSNCIEDGCMSREVVEFVFRISPRQFQQLFGEKETPQTANVPIGWSKHFRTRGRREPDHAM
jgi:hypothetical protein